MTTQPALADTSHAAAEVARGSSAATAQAPDAAQPAAGAGSVLRICVLTFDQHGQVVSSVPVPLPATVPEASGSPAAAVQNVAGSERSRKRSRQEDDAVEVDVGPLRTRSPQQPQPKRLRASGTSSVRLSGDAAVLPAFG